jgi:hypothetical protein
MNQAGPPLENCSPAASPKWSDVPPRSHAHSSVSILGAALLWLSAGVILAEPTLIFSDDFNREEISSEREEVGNGWTTNTQRRAPGKRQALLREGAFQLATDPAAKHVVVAFHETSFSDGILELRFRRPADGTLGVAFSDPECKNFHAGHLLVLRLLPDSLTPADLKTVSADLNILAKLKEGRRDAELDALLKAKTKSFPLQLTAEQWHTLQLCVERETMTAAVDGAEVGSITSPGVGHPHERVLEISNNKPVRVDDVKIWSVP